MSANSYLILAYVLGLALLGGYALSLRIAIRSAGGGGCRCCSKTTPDTAGKDA